MTHAGPGPRSRERVGIAGLVLTALGAGAVVSAFTFLNWFRDATGNGSPKPADSTFGDVDDALSTIGLTGRAEARFVPMQYFNWLGWTLLVVVVVAAVFACLPTGAAPVARVMGPLLALVAVGLTFAAIDLIEITDTSVTADQPDYLEYLEQAGPAFYAAVVGFLLIGIGARKGTRVS